MLNFCALETGYRERIEIILLFLIKFPLFYTKLELPKEFHLPQKCDYFAVSDSLFNGSDRARVFYSTSIEIVASAMSEQIAAVSPPLSVTRSSNAVLYH